MKERLLFFLAVSLVLLTGCAQESAVPFEDDLTVQEDVLKVSLCSLLKNPRNYLDSPVRTTATMTFVGENIFAGDGNYFLESAGCQVETNPWAPVSVATCPPQVKNCDPPMTITNYFDKELELTGVLKEVPDMEYDGNDWVEVGTKLVFSEVKDVSIIS